MVADRGAPRRAQTHSLSTQKRAAYDEHDGKECEALPESPPHSLLLTSICRQTGYLSIRQVNCCIWLACALLEGSQKSFSDRRSRRLNDLRERSDGASRAPSLRELGLIGVGKQFESVGSSP